MYENQMKYVWSKLGLRNDLIAIFIKTQILWDGKEARFFSLRFCEAEELLSQPECWEKRELEEILIKCSPAGQRDAGYSSTEHEAYIGDVDSFMRLLQ
jgi:hypothetical protein